MKLFKRKHSSRKLVVDEAEVPTREPATAMESFLMSLQQEHSQPSRICIVGDSAPMLPASFAQSVSYDPECSCDFDAKLAEQRWQAYFRKRNAQKMANALPPKRSDSSLEFTENSSKFSVASMDQSVLVGSRCVEC